MKNINKHIFWLVILVVGIGLVSWANFGRNRTGNIFVNQPEMSASPSVSPSPSKSGVTNLGKSTAKDVQSLTPEEVEKLFDEQYIIQQSVPYSQLTEPATCQVQGTLKFLNPNTYETIGAKISYTGVDSPARQIKWKISPSGDDLGVGPNLMAQLKLPDGESPITAVLPASPHSKKYVLTASITYGRLVGEGVRVYEVPCSGQAKIELDY